MLADNRILVREGLRLILESDENIEVTEISGDEECVHKLKSLKPDILILNVEMPEKKGLVLLENISRMDPSVKILILASFGKSENLKRALELKINGYLTETCASRDLIRAVKQIFAGRFYIPPELSFAEPRFTEPMFLLADDKPLQNTENDKKYSLTNREMEVLIQVAKGMFNKEIATFLNISERTVKNHLSNIFKKIEVSDRTQAAVFAIKNEIVKLV